MSNDLKLGVKVDLKGAEASLKQLEGSFGKVGKQISDGFSNMGKSIATPTGAVIALATAMVTTSIAAIKLGDSIAKSADALAESAQKAGLSLSSYQKLGAMAKFAGSDVDAMAKSVTIVTKNAFAAVEGNKELSGTFNKLGVSLKDANGQLKSQETIYQETILGLAGMQNGTEKTATAIKLLGKSGAELVPMLNQGAEAMKAQLATGDKYVTLSDSLAKSSGVSNDHLDMLAITIKKTTNESFTPLVKVMADLTGSFLQSEPFKIFLAGINAAGKAISTVANLVNEANNGFNLEKIEKSQARIADLEKLRVGYAEEYARYTGIGSTGSAADQLSMVNAIDKEITAEKKKQADLGALTKQYWQDINIEATTTNDKIKETTDITTKLVKAQKDYKVEIIESSDAVSNMIIDLVSTKKINPFENIMEQWMGAKSFIARESKGNVAGFTVPYFKTSPFQTFALKDKDLLKTVSADYESFITKSANETFNLNTQIENQIKARSKLIKEIESDKIKPNTEEFDKANTALKTYDANIKVLQEDVIRFEDVISDAQKQISFFADPEGTKLLNVAYKDLFNDFAKGYIQDALPAIKAMEFGGKNMADNLTIGVGKTIDAILSLGNITEDQAKKMKDLAKPMIGDMTTPTSIWGKMFKVTNEDEENLLKGVEAAGQVKDATMNMIGAISDAKQANAIREAEELKKAQQNQLDNSKMTDRQRAREQKKIDAEFEAKKAASFEKTKGLKITEIGMNAASGIMSAWEQAMTLPPIAAQAYGIAMTGLLGTTAGFQADQVRRSKYENGGIIPGSSYTGDHIPVSVNSDEMILNKKQQKQLFEMANGRSVGGSSGINITIQGNVTDDKLRELEDMLTSLQSNGRLSGIVGA